MVPKGAHPMVSVARSHSRVLQTKKQRLDDAQFQLLSSSRFLLRQPERLEGQRWFSLEEVHFAVVLPVYFLGETEEVMNRMLLERQADRSEQRR